MSLQNITHHFTPAFLNDSALIKSLGEDFVLCENGNMVFHWSDFHETCDFVRAHLEKNDVLLKDFKLKEKNLEKLHLIPVWVRTDKKVHESTMFELYENYILNQSRLLGGVDPFVTLQISFISATGPFKAMSVAQCFNKNTYRDFVLLNLLKSKLPRRDFRIRLKSKILLEYGPHFNEAHLISLEQLTTHGMLLSVESDAYVKKMAKEEEIRVLINTNILKEGVDKDLTDLKHHLSQYAFNLLYSSRKEDGLSAKLSDCSIQSSFDYSNNKRLFLFITYDKFSKEDSAKVKALTDFMSHAMKLVRSHYQEKLHLKKSA